MTLGEMRQRMSAAELSAWMAYSRIEPIGEYRGDLRAGMISATLANVNRGKSSPARSPKDFMPIYKEQENKMREADPTILAKELISHFSQNNKRQEKKQPQPPMKTL